MVDKHILSQILDDKLEKFVAPLYAKIAELEGELEKRSIDHLHTILIHYPKQPEYHIVAFCHFASKYGLRDKPNASLLILLFYGLFKSGNPKDLFSRKMLKFLRDI